MMKETVTIRVAECINFLSLSLSLSIYIYIYIYQIISAGPYPFISYAEIVCVLNCSDSAVCIPPRPARGAALLYCIIHLNIIDIIV